MVGTLVIKLGPTQRVDPGVGPVRVCQKTGRCNDPAGQPVTWARPSFFFQMWDLKPISILCFFQCGIKKPFSLNTST